MKYLLPEVLKETNLLRTLSNSHLELRCPTHFSQEPQLTCFTENAVSALIVLSVYKLILDLMSFTAGT